MFASLAFREGNNNILKFHRNQFPYYESARLSSEGCRGPVASLLTNLASSEESLSSQASSSNSYASNELHQRRSGAPKAVIDDDGFFFVVGGDCFLFSS